MTKWPQQRAICKLDMVGWRQRYFLCRKPVSCLQLITAGTRDRSVGVRYRITAVLTRAGETR